MILVKPKVYKIEREDNFKYALVMASAFYTPTDLHEFKLWLGKERFKDIGICNDEQILFLDAETVYRFVKTYPGMLDE